MIRSVLTYKNIININGQNGAEALSIYNKSCNDSAGTKRTSFAYYDNVILTVTSMGLICVLLQQIHYNKCINIRVRRALGSDLSAYRARYPNAVPRSSTVQPRIFAGYDKFQQCIAPLHLRLQKLTRYNLLTQVKYDGILSGYRKIIWFNVSVSSFHGYSSCCMKYL